MTALSLSLSKAVLDHELPGHEFKPGSQDPIQIMASTYGGRLDDWLIGDLDLPVEDFITAMRDLSDFDLGLWLERHRDQISF